MRGGCAPDLGMSRCQGWTVVALLFIIACTMVEIALELGGGGLL